MEPGRGNLRTRHLLIALRVPHAVDAARVLARHVAWQAPARCTVAGDRRFT
jgi:hypothetical protein